MLTYEHGNKEGTGSRLVVELCKVKRKSDAATVRFKIQAQTKGETSDGEHPMFSDSEDDAASISLDVKKIAHVLMVLDGKNDSIMNDKKPVTVKRSPNGADMIYFDRVLKPYAGYAMHIKQVAARVIGGRYAYYEGRIILNVTEGAALRDALRSSMGRLAFGE